MFKKVLIVLILIGSIGMNAFLAYYFIYHDKIIDFKLEVKDQYDLDKEKNIWVRKAAEDINPGQFDHSDQLIDSVRNYVHNNSIHREQTPYHINRAFVTDSVIKDLYLYHHGESDVIPELSCSPYAWVMRRLLLAVDIPSRVLIYFHVKGKVLMSHTVLEVYNESSNRWQLQDPDLGVYFMDTIRDQRVSFNAMKGLDSNAYVPCDNDTCTWDLIYYDLRDKEQLAIAKYYYFKERYKDQVVLIDGSLIENRLDSFDVYKYFEGEKNI